MKFFPFFVECFQFFFQFCFFGENFVGLAEICTAGCHVFVSLGDGIFRFLDLSFYLFDLVCQFTLCCLLFFLLQPVILCFTDGLCMCGSGRFLVVLQGFFQFVSGAFCFLLQIIVLVAVI